jgi:hypothetical protein
VNEILENGKERIIKTRITTVVKIALKSSSAISSVHMELVSNVSETIRLHLQGFIRNFGYQLHIDTAGILSA